MIEKCDKCLTDVHFTVKYAYPGDFKLKKVFLCHLCSSAFNINLIEEFMKDDFGSFPIGKISRDMINARKKRASGENTFQLNGDNKGQDCE